MSAGFDIVVPSVPTENFQVTGADCQVLTVNLKPGEKVTSEPGAMMFMSSDMGAEARCGGCTRTCAGESCCKVEFTNNGNGDGFIALTPDFPAKVLPIDLTAMGGSYVCKKGAYFSHIGDVSVTIDCDCNPATCCFGGMGMIRQKIEGDGTIFLSAGGTVLQKQLADGERLIIDTDSVVGWQPSAKLGIRTAGGCCTCCFGGEGLFNTTLQGPGHVVVQSMSFEKYKRAVAPPVQATSANDTTTVNSGN